MRKEYSSNLGDLVDALPIAIEAIGEITTRQKLKSVVSKTSKVIAKINHILDEDEIIFLDNYINNLSFIAGELRYNVSFFNYEDQQNRLVQDRDVYDNLIFDYVN